MNPYYHCTLHTGRIEFNCWYSSKQHIDFPTRVHVLEVSVAIPVGLLHVLECTHTWREQLLKPQQTQYSQSRTLSWLTLLHLLGEIQRMRLLDVRNQFCIDLRLHPDWMKDSPLRNLSITREFTLASLRICGEVQDHCEWPQKRR